MHAMAPLLDQYVEWKNRFWLGVGVVQLLVPQPTGDSYRDSVLRLDKLENDEWGHVVRVSFIGEELDGPALRRRVLECGAQVLLIDGCVGRAVDQRNVGILLHISDSGGDLFHVLKIAFGVRLRHPTRYIGELEKDARRASVVAVVRPEAVGVDRLDVEETDLVFGWVLPWQAFRHVVPSDDSG